MATDTAPATLQTQITEALAELRCARTEYDHSPNADTERTVAYAEWRLGGLLDKLPRA
jgi:hypothetical protein